ncbi:MAG: hypothetical protein CMH60_07935 [Myxococcales bacterium]|nr:hypothetical protein [Myxococcales bacterium]|tara:strand:+ start:250 stop:576 length:327 start_codon:yes stop_codon:yes gene_type:complete
MEQPVSNERRNLPRCPTAVRVQPLDGGSWMMAQDLSFGGMLVTTAEPRWPGSFIPVAFVLERGEEPIEALCQVMDLVEVPRGIGLALRFIRMPEGGRARLGDFLEGVA